MRWYVLKVQSNREKSIRDSLLRRVKRDSLEPYFGEIVIPTEKRIETKGGKKRVFEQKLYPGYIMIHMVLNDETWYLVRDTSGVGDFTGAAGKPLPMSDEEVRSMISRGEQDKVGEPARVKINFAPGDKSASLSSISNEQQKFYRARVSIPVKVRNSQGEEIHVQGVNLSTGGMGLDGVKDPLRYAGLVDVSFILPESDVSFEAKARLMWVGDEGRVGVRFAVIEPALFEQLQRWTNRKMKDEGWDFSG
jgi:transcription antitermination factor NusG